MPSEREALRRSAEGELLAALEAIRLVSRLLARGRAVGGWERELLEAIRLAVRRAEGAIERLRR
jgi:hypothetical protein